MAEFDVAVVGLGVMGSAALDALAQRGLRVVGIEQFEPGHDRGSSHGLTRIIRFGYYEHPSYVPLVRRAADLWRDIEARSGHKLMTVTGIVEIGAPDSGLIAGTLQSSRLHGLAHEVLDAPALMARFPAFRVPPNFIGVFQPDAGFLAAEPSIEAMSALARAAGAEVRSGETVRAIEPRNGGVRIVSDRGTIDAGRVIVATGAWLTKLMPDLKLPIRVTRQAVAWFEPMDPALFTAERFPVFMLETGHGIHYGFPFDATEGLKIAKHFHADEAVDPDDWERSVTSGDEALIRGAVSEHIPAANGPLRSTRTCLYTMTPDGDFIIDRLPGSPQIVVASPCSGHGFKFAPAIGEILADLATTGSTSHDISRFGIGRFG